MLIEHRMFENEVESYKIVLLNRCATKGANKLMRELHNHIKHTCDTQMETSLLKRIE